MLRHRTAPSQPFRLRAKRREACDRNRRAGRIILPPATGTRGPFAAPRQRSADPARDPSRLGGNPGRVTQSSGLNGKSLESDPHAHFSRYEWACQAPVVNEPPAGVGHRVSTGLAELLHFPVRSRRSTLCRTRDHAWLPPPKIADVPSEAVGMTMDLDFRPACQPPDWVNGVRSAPKAFLHGAASSLSSGTISTGEPPRDHREIAGSRTLEVVKKRNHHRGRSETKSRPDSADQSPG